MAYIVNLKNSAEKELDDLPREIYDRIIKRLVSLKEIPRPHGVKKLRGQEGYRIRVGNYRILYTVDDTQKVIEIISIAPRKNAYR
ncbi:type II toxin-antitoxin system RelE/ParE family toxin [Candidatus Poribacteria bacterium]|nr:type II toxin-antitoxin system RelE/ParE family toxin [Candidatus Poribacteria bacterium]